MEISLSLKEIIELGAKDTLFFGHYFFPRAIRQESPEFHAEICQAIDEPANEKVACKIARGFAKTTLAKIILAKRTAYMIMRTGLVVSETAEHSVETVKWLKHAVEQQGEYARVFGLERGDKFSTETGERYTWRDDKIQIICTLFKDENGRHPVVTLVGTGIFGQSRGLNVEDYRPDFIMLDDVIDEDNAKTPEQRRKVSERIYGAIANTLAPRSEAPNATILFLQTPLHRDDAIEQAKLDPEWTYLEYSCFDSNGRSRWEARFPTVELLKKKQGFINRNMLDVWLREMEVTITDAALAYFRPAWLTDHFWHNNSDLPPLNEMTLVLGLDPTPPPKDSAMNSSAAQKDLDDAVMVVLGVHKGHVYLLDGYACKSPVPSELWLKMVEFFRRYRFRAAGVETILFARVLKFYFEEKMLTERCYIPIQPIEDRRKKSDRIRQELTDLMFEGRFHVNPKFTDFCQQVFAYPDVSHDDWLDAVAIALMTLHPFDILEGEYEVLDDPDESALLEDWRPY